MLPGDHRRLQGPRWGQHSVAGGTSVSPGCPLCGEDCYAAVTAPAASEKEAGVLWSRGHSDEPGAVLTPQANAGE